MAKNPQKGSEEEWEDSFGGLANPWEPTPGAMLAGILESREAVTNDDGEFTSYRIRTTEDSLVSIAGFAADKGLADIPNGTPVRVTFLGMRKMKLGQARDYRIAVPKGTKRVVREHPADEGQEPESPPF